MRLYERSMSIHVNDRCVLLFRYIPYKEFFFSSLDLSLSLSVSSHVETYISICSYTSLMFSNVFDLPVLIHVPICIIRIRMLNTHINLSMWIHHVITYYSVSISGFVYVKLSPFKVMVAAFRSIFIRRKYCTTCNLLI